MRSYGIPVRHFRGRNNQIQTGRNYAFQRTRRPQRKLLCDRAGRKTRRERIPMFGICIGHQMLALSQGAKTYKLKYGHRGGNQPVKDVNTGRVYVSTQNHGYAVEGDSLPVTAKMSFVNVNDGTCEGIDYSNSNVFSVQFHPEACAGPLDTGYLFDRFMENMEGRK